MGFGQEWKERFGRKLDACDGKLDEIGRGVAGVRTALDEAADRSASPPQVSDQELYKLREAVSTGTMVLREENRELRRRQERMLSDLKDLRLEIIGNRTGAHPPPVPVFPEPDEPDKADEPDKVGEVGEVGEAGGETAEADGAPPSGPPSETPGTQDDGRRQEEHAVREQDGERPETGDGVPAAPAGTASSGEAGETPEERVRAVKKAAGQALRNRFRDSRGGAGQPPGRQDGHGTPRDPLAEHAELLLNAAGVSRAELVCHRDTWEFLLVQAARHPRFRVPGTVREDAEHGLVRTHLSGPSLIAALISLWKTREEPGQEVDADWAMAAVLYDRIRDRLHGAGRGDGRRTVRIVLDDGDGPEGTAAAGSCEDDTPEESGASGREPEAA